MKYLITALAATLIMAVGAGRADAQQASVRPGSASGTENETLEFTISGSWEYDAEIEYFTEDVTATGGSDYMPLDSWRFCIEGTETTDRPTDYCEFGGPEESQTAPVVGAALLRRRRTGASGPLGSLWGRLLGAALGRGI